MSKLRRFVVDVWLREDGSKKVEILAAGDVVVHEAHLRGRHEVPARQDWRDYVIDELPLHPELDDG